MGGEGRKGKAMEGNGIADRGGGQGIGSGGRQEMGGMGVPATINHHSQLPAIVSYLVPWWSLGSVVNR